MPAKVRLQTSCIDNCDQALVKAKVGILLNTSRETLDEDSKLNQDTVKDHLQALSNSSINY